MMCITNKISCVNELVFMFSDADRSLHWTGERLCPRPGKEVRLTFSFKCIFADRCTDTFLRLTHTFNIIIYIKMNNRTFCYHFLFLFIFSVVFVVQTCDCQTAGADLQRDSWCLFRGT